MRKNAHTHAPLTPRKFSVILLLAEWQSDRHPARGPVGVGAPGALQSAVRAQAGEVRRQGDRAAVESTRLPDAGKRSDLIDARLGRYLSHAACTR